MQNNYKDMDRPYVAKQFNGPIVSAFIKAVYNFLHKDTDANSEYLNELSIDTANTSHLQFIGKLMGIQLFDVLSDAAGGKYLTYHVDIFDTSEFSYNDGWSEDYIEGEFEGQGVFGTGAEQGYPIPLSNAQYAQILNALARIPSASVCSLYAIDTVVHVLTQSTDYSISYSTEYPDLIQVSLGKRTSLIFINILQGVFDRLFLGGTTVKVIRG